MGLLLLFLLSLLKTIGHDLAKLQRCPLQSAQFSFGPRRWHGDKSRVNIVRMQLWRRLLGLSSASLVRLELHALCVQKLLKVE